MTLADQPAPDNSLVTAAHYQHNPLPCDPQSGHLVYVKTVQTDIDESELISSSNRPPDGALDTVQLITTAVTQILATSSPLTYPPHLSATTPPVQIYNRLLNRAESEVNCRNDAPNSATLPAPISLLEEIGRKWRFRTVSTYAHPAAGCGVKAEHTNELASGYWRRPTRAGSVIILQGWENEQRVPVGPDWQVRLSACLYMAISAVMFSHARLSSSLLVGTMGGCRPYGGVLGNDGTLVVVTRAPGDGGLRIAREMESDRKREMTDCPQHGFVPGRREITPGAPCHGPKRGTQVPRGTHCHLCCYLLKRKYRVMADDGPTMSKWDEPVGSAKKDERKPTPWWIWMALLGTVGNILVVIVVYLWTTMYS
ncbi:hypothetical protein Bbelb_168250 [Branchiostoma belcheri]|nr:hypothetical protein Bbelb_168250 [Branchiostoma belcheri]